MPELALFLNAGEVLRFEMNEECLGRPDITKVSLIAYFYLGELH